MAKIVKEPNSGVEQYKLIFRRLTAARTLREPTEKSWRRYQRIVKGDHWHGYTNQEFSELFSSENPRDRITVNVTASYLHDFLPFLVRQDPTFNLIARPKLNPEETRFLQQKGRVAGWTLNYSWEEYGMQGELKKAVMNGMVLGTGIMRTGWNGALVTDDKNGQQIQLDSKMRENSPFIRSVDPFKFYFDPLAPDGTLKTARWCAEISYIPLQDVVFADASAGYKPSVLKKIREGANGYSPTLAKSYQAVDKEVFSEESSDALAESDEEYADNPLVVGIEYFDRKLRRYYFMLEGVEEPLIEEPLATDYLDGDFPYVMYSFELNSDPSRHHGNGLVSILEDQQYELNRIRTCQFIHRRKYGVRKIGILGDAVEQKDLDKLTSGQEEYVLFKVPPDQAMKVLETPPITQDQYMIDSVIREDMRELMGRDQLLTGGSLPSRTSAREIDARREFIGLKIQDRIERVDTFVNDIGKQVFQHIQANAPQEFFVKITGEGSESLWEKVSKKDIQGDFQFKVKSTSQPPDDPISQREHRFNIVQLVLQNAQMLAQQGHVVDFKRLFDWMLEPFDSPEVEAFIQQVDLPEGPVESDGQQVSGEAGDRGTAVAKESANPESALLGELFGGV